MKKLFVSFVCSALMAAPCFAKESTMNEKSSLTAEEKAVVSVAATAARGNYGALETALNDGLNAGVPVNTFKEILVQLYAYSGFPASLNALETLRSVVTKRCGKDETGAEPSPLPAGKSVDFGTENQTKLIGRAVTGGVFDFAPAIDEYLKAHLFGDIFARDNVDWKTRGIATIAMLAQLPHAAPQLKSHIAVGKHNGLTDPQVNEILKIAAVRDEADFEKQNTFGKGTLNTAYARYFIGTSYLNPLTDPQKTALRVSNVTFEPKARNNRHIHRATAGGGQILICTAGEGWYQEDGKPAVSLKPGTVITIPANVKHWHGAKANSWFSHIAIEVPGENLSNEWLTPVSDEEYFQLHENDNSN